MHIFQACILITLFYARETWITYMRQEHRLNSFRLRCLRRILDVKWQRIIDSEILNHAGTPSMYSLVIHCIDDGRISTKTSYTVN